MPYNISYNNKIYAFAKDTANKWYTCYLDINDLSWHQTVCNGDAIPEDFASVCIGKYLFIGPELEFTDDHLFTSSHLDYLHKWDYAEDHSELFNMTYYEIEDGKVYDMEKDKYIYEIPYAVHYSYYGGNNSIIMNDGEWAEMQYDPEAESFVTINTIGADDSDADFAIMSRTHYAVIDEYGIFVRSFEKGKDDEKTIALFED